MLLEGKSKSIKLKEKVHMYRRLESCPNILPQMSNTSTKRVALPGSWDESLARNDRSKLELSAYAMTTDKLSSPKMRREILDWNGFVKAALGNYFRGWGSARIDIAKLEVLQRMTKKDMVEFLKNDSMPYKSMDYALLHGVTLHNEPELTLDYLCAWPQGGMRLWNLII